MSGMFDSLLRVAKNVMGAGYGLDGKELGIAGDVIGGGLQNVGKVGYAALKRAFPDPLVSPQDNPNTTGINQSYNIDQYGSPINNSFHYSPQDLASMQAQQQKDNGSFAPVDYNQALQGLQQTQPNPPQVQAGNNTQPFSQFDMGKSDYSYLKPQLQSLYQGEPLANYIDQFIQSGNQYGVDPRVMATIGRIESSGGANYPQPNNPNYANPSYPSKINQVQMRDTYDPFGYLVNTPGVMRTDDPTKPDSPYNIYEGANNAGFTSMAQAIDRLTRRFSPQYNNGKSAYPAFSQNPTLEALQAVYNANPKEKDNYMKLASQLAQQYYGQ